MLGTMGNIKNKNKNAIPVLKEMKKHQEEMIAWKIAGDSEGINT